MDATTERAVFEAGISELRADFAEMAQRRIQRYEHGIPDISISYETVLADLRRKRDEIDAAISAVEAAYSRYSACPGSEDGRYLGMTIVDATIKFLTVHGKAATSKEIATELAGGGILLMGDDPTNTIGTVLWREAHTKGRVVRCSRGVWTLRKENAEGRGISDALTPHTI